MGKGNCIYRVVVYIGGMNSRETRVIYTCSKESKAEQYLHKYCKEHPEVTKAFIERSYERATRRNNKYMREDED